MCVNRSRNLIKLVYEYVNICTWFNFSFHSFFRIHEPRSKSLIFVENRTETCTRCWNCALSQVSYVGAWVGIGCMPYLSTMYPLSAQNDVIWPGTEPLRPESAHILPGTVYVWVCGWVGGWLGHIPSTHPPTVVKLVINDLFKRTYVPYR